MARPSGWQRRIAAAGAAFNLLDAHNVDQTQQIDVFGLCERLGLWLAFVPLDNVLGAFLPEGSGGVLITTQRPLTVQRYTAGHELGHWRMDHGPTADEHDQVFGTAPGEREYLAQIFAGNLLMPPPLVTSILGRIRPSASTPLTGAHCYTLAREAGVSYEAAIRQLVNLDQMSRGQAAELLRLSPLAIKTGLAYGRRPVNGWADVWPVDELWDDEILDLRLEDEAVISLPENRSSGFRWMFADAPEPTREPTDPPPSFAPVPAADELGEKRRELLEGIADAEPHPSAPGPIIRQLRARGPADETADAVTEPDAASIDVVGDDYLSTRAPSLRPRDARALRLAIAASASETSASDDHELPATVAGATGRRLIGVRFGRPGAHTVRLVYRSPYATGPDLESFAIHAIVETRRTGISVDQLATEGDDEEWVQQVRERQAAALPPGLDPDVSTQAE